MNNHKPAVTIQSDITNPTWLGGLRVDYNEDETITFTAVSSRSGHDKYSWTVTRKDLFKIFGLLGVWKKS